MPDADPDIDSGLLAQLNATAPSGGGDTKAAPDDGVDQNLLAQLNATGPGTKPSPAPAKPSSHPPAPTTHSTLFRQAAAPSPTGAPDPELSWGQVGQQALANAPTSIMQELGGIAHGIGGLFTGETEKNLGQLGAGVASQFGIGPQDAKQKVQTEALAKAVEQHYTTAYGSMKGFKKNLATDPFGAAMDASLIADPAAGALGKIGEAGKLGALSDAAGVAGKALSYVNPVKSALAVARAPGAVVSAAGRGAGSLTSRVPGSALNLATAAGAHSDPAVQAAFSRFASGAGTNAEFGQVAKNALGQIKAERQAAYLAKKGSLTNAPVSYQSTYDALNAADQQLALGDPALVAGQKAALDQIRASVDKVSQGPNNDLINADALKQQIWDYGSDKLPGNIGPIYHGVKADIRSVDPEYETLMDNYKIASDNINDLTKTLGLGQRAAASTAIVKGLQALKTSPKSNLLQQLIAKDPRVGAMLAGAAVEPWSQHSSIWEAAAGAGLLPAIFHPFTAGLAIPGAMAGLAASSPRLVGSAANMAGKASKALNAAGSPLVQGVAKGLYYGSRPDALSPGTAGPSLPRTKPSGTRVPRGIRNNNPTNLTSTASGWPGQIGKDSDFATFDNPQHGMEAADKNLAAYGEKHGIDTVRQAVMRWTGNGASPAYINGVAKAANVRPDDHIDLSDPNLRAAMLHAIVGFENGPQYAARGGRIERADGGKVEDQHEFLVQRLMNVAKQARTASNKATEPLLKVPDSTVARALEVAGRAI